MAHRRFSSRLAVVALLVGALVATTPAAPSLADTGCPTAVAPTLASGVYDIDTTAKLQWAKDSGSMANSYRLTANLDMSGCTWSNGIGTSASPFTGTFDGNGKTISNLTISGGSSQFLGFVDSLTGSVTDLTLASPTVSSTADWIAALAGQLGATGTVSNVTVTSASITGRQLVAAVIGEVVSGGTVSNVTASGSVTATGSRSGGIAGSSAGTMTNLSTSVTVNGTDNVGGFVGSLSSAGSITTGSATGAVTGSGSEIGGAVGFAAGSSPTCGTVTNVTSSGRVEGVSYVSGLIGSGNCYFVIRSSSSSTVVGTSSHVGGIIGGENFGGTITASFFTGSVQAAHTVGGLAGATRSTITDSYSTGSVTATSTTNGSRAGGLIGWQVGGSVTRAVATGSVTVPSGGTTVGGLVASSSGSISASVWDVQTTGFSSSSGSGATGYTTQQLRDYVLYNSDNLNWNITDGISAGDGISTGTTWSVCSGVNSGYPFLTRQGLSGSCGKTMAYNGNINTAGTAPSDGSTPYTSGDTVTVLGNTGSLTKTSRTFAGWNTKANGTGTPYSPGDTFTITASTMLFAQWSTAPVVLYNSNGGTGSVSSTSGASGSTITLSTGSGFSRTGYTLSRWDTSAAGTGTSYAKGEVITMPAGGLTLYAVWTALPAVTYNSNGGSGTVATVYGASGSSVTLSTGSGFSRTGYTLSRWDTSATGTGTSYAKGQSITMPASGLALYAVWTQDAVATTTTTTQPATPAATTTTTVASSPASPTTVVDGGSDTGTPTTVTPAVNTPPRPGTVSGSPVVTAPRATTSTSSPTTTTTTTTVPTSPDVVSVEPGTAGATVGGRPADAQLTERDGSIVVRVGNATVTYSIFDSTGTRKSISAASETVLRSGDRVKVDFEGFADDATGEAWIAPDGTLIASTTLTGGQGTVEGSVPDSATEGSRRIVVTSTSADGDDVVVAYGVDISQGGGSGPSWSLVFLVILGLAAVGAFLVPAARRRRSDD